jgi:maltose-binding protein MalE
VFLTDASNFAPLFACGAFAPIDGFVRRDARTFRPDDFFPQQMQAGTIKGQLHALPTDVNI